MRAIKPQYFIVLLMLMLASFQVHAAEEKPDSLHIYKFEYVHKSIPEGERLVVWIEGEDGQKKLKGKLGAVGADYFYIDSTKVMASEVNSLRLNRPLRNFIGIGGEVVSGGFLAIMGIGAIGAVIQNENADIGLFLLSVVAVPTGVIYGLSHVIKTKRFKFVKDKWTLMEAPKTVELAQ